ncbi:LysM peptidoglycan-binding domain-containing protein [Thermospira aquatica]|uniref:LysM peptidoglycan-binding domain-containing protein n=1 Tax=Thermospira aquatica TaxID=2828656 RepID=A0AAX3BBM0_9SPIR|nr:LysM peptidoglycan-binding domain-containing protein [Thermospira aquatica]URA09414.1 LysM peptidoglycan-binding domain-containing protein [Thermospira aquatica]
MVLAGVNSGYNPSTATTWEAAQGIGMNWAINSTVSFINKGWKMDESGRLYWGLTNEGEVTEAWMDLGIGTLKSGLSFVFEGNYTGYGAKQKESLLAYALSKGMDIYKYNLYQQGVFGKELQDKYAGQNVFDLAGGIDLTILTRNWKEGERSMSGAVGLRILSTGMELHSGAGEFGGFGWSIDNTGNISWNIAKTWNNTMEDFKTIGQGVNAMVSGVTYLAMSVGNIFTPSAQREESKTPEEQRQAEKDIALPGNEKKKRLKGTRVVKKGDTLSKIAEEEGMTVEELLELNPQLKDRENLLHIDELINLSKDNIEVFAQMGGPTEEERELSKEIGEKCKRKRQQAIEQTKRKLTQLKLNELKEKNVSKLSIEKPTEGVTLTNMSEEQFNKAMDIVESGIGRWWYLLTSSDNREFKQTVRKLGDMNDKILAMQQVYVNSGKMKPEDVKTLRGWLNAKGAVILGDEGQGSNFKPLSNSFDTYDDKFSVLSRTRDGKIVFGEFTRGNMNPTNSYVDSSGKRMETNSTQYWGELGVGIYGFDYVFRGDKSYYDGTKTVHGYYALQLYDNYNSDGDGDIKTLRELDNNNEYRKRVKENPKDKIGAVLFHPGGTAWNWSHGCQTIYAVDYQYFIDLFYDRVPGQYNYGKDGVYFRYGKNIGGSKYEDNFNFFIYYPGL